MRHRAVLRPVAFIFIRCSRSKSANALSSLEKTSANGRGRNALTHRPIAPFALGGGPGTRDGSCLKADANTRLRRFVQVEQPLVNLSFAPMQSGF